MRFYLSKVLFVLSFFFANTILAAGTGTISASPSQCVIPPGQVLCTISITWSTSNVVDAQVKILGMMFAHANSGTGTAPWISDTPAVFELWGDGVLLNQITVMGVHDSTPVPPNSSGPSGSISASPSTCIIPAGKDLCSANINWTTSGASDVKVKIQGMTFSGGVTGAGIAPWISDTNPAVFELWGDGILLGKTTVIGQRAVAPAPPTPFGFISASPASCVIPTGQDLCTVKLNWTTSNVADVKVKIQGMTFSGGVTGVGIAPWISLNPALFELWGDGKLLSTVTVIGVPATASRRSILDPLNVTADPSNFYAVDHVNKPWDRFFLDVRYQRPDPTDSTSSPIRFNTTYSALKDTGLGPWDSLNQRGPLGGNQSQSVYQLKGTEVGIFMRSEDSPHPSTLPYCQPNCSGYQKHTIYEHNWSEPVFIFSGKTGNRSLDIEAEIQVHKFAEWNNSGGGTRGVVAGQLAYTLFLQDPAGKNLIYVIFIYDSNSNTGSGNESSILEVIGAGNNGYFVSSSLKKNRPMTYTTVDTTAQYEYTHSTWSNFRPYKIRITPQNILNAITELNNRGGSLSTDVWNYKISNVGINQEVYYENNGDAWIMGTSFRNLRVSETLK